MPDIAGEMTPDGHVFPVRVYYEDTDMSGLVYHASYLRFAERARTELLRRTGTEQDQLMAEAGLAFAVRHMEIDFRAAARLDDLLEVVTRFTEFGGASLRAEQTIRRAGATLEHFPLTRNRHRPAPPPGHPAPVSSVGGRAGERAGAVRSENALVAMFMKLACIDRHGRPARMPIDLRAALHHLT